MASEGRGHEELAAELAEAYASGDEPARDQIAQECEAQGIVAVLVADALRELGLHHEFIEAMKRSVARFRRH